LCDASRHPVHPRSSCPSRYSMSGLNFFPPMLPIVCVFFASAESFQLINFPNPSPELQVPLAQQALKLKGPVPSPCTPFWSRMVRTTSLFLFYFLFFFLSPRCVVLRKRQVSGGRLFGQSFLNQVCTSICIFFLGVIPVMVRYHFRSCPDSQPLSGWSTPVKFLSGPKFLVRFFSSSLNVWLHFPGPAFHIPGTPRRAPWAVLWSKMVRGFARVTTLNEVYRHFFSPPPVRSFFNLAWPFFLVWKA